MSFYYLDERSYAKFQEICRWFDATVGSGDDDEKPDQLANSLVPFELTSDPKQNNDDPWTAKGKQLYFSEKTGYELNAKINDHETELFFPLSAEKPAYAKGARLFCIHRGRWEAFEGAGVSIHVGTVTRPINSGLDAENGLHGGSVREDGSENVVRAFAGMLRADESISEGRRVEWVVVDGVNRIINAECEP